MTVNHEPSLHEELHALDTEFPGWHCVTRRGGTFHADDDSGHTADARTPQLLRHEIAAEIHHLQAPEYPWGNPDIHPFDGPAAA